MTTETTTATFLDRPIIGEKGVEPSRNTVEQLGPDEFRAALDAIFADQRVAGVHWTQYTPYFNDGSECVFSVGEFEIAFYEPVDGALYVEDEIDVDGTTLSAYGTWGLGDAPGYQGLVGLLKDFNSSAFETLLRDTFGDHVQVTALRDRFLVDEYSHD